MKVLWRSWGRYLGEKRELVDVLEPSCMDGPGELENISNQVEVTAKAFARLAALLVEKKVLTLEEAFKVSGNDGEVELLPDDPLDDLEMVGHE